MYYYENFDLTYFNSYRLKSIASKAYFPESSDDIEWIFSAYPIESIVILGHGNNIILSKDYYHDKVFVITNNLNQFQIVNENKIYAQAGLSLKELSILAYGAGLSGLEVFYDIPSSVGGAAFMNAGSGNEDFLSLCDEIEYFDYLQKKLLKFNRENISYSYRSSMFQHSKGIIVSALLNLNKSEKEHIYTKMIEIKNTRWQKQPRTLPNAGSVFKRPKGYYVGTMIEQLGLKGYAIGGAQISEKHAGFIVNIGNATGTDIIRLIDFIKEKIFKHFQVELELEQIII